MSREYPPECVDEAILMANLRKLSENTYLPNDDRLLNLHRLASIKSTGVHQQARMWSILDRLLASPPWEGIYTTDEDVEFLRQGFNTNYLDYMGVTVQQAPGVRYHGCHWKGDFILGVKWQPEEFPEPPDLPTMAKIYALLIREHIKRHNFATLHAVMHAMQVSEEHGKLCAPVDVVPKQSLRAPGIEEFMEEAHLSFFPKGTTMHRRFYGSKPREPPSHILYSPCRYE